jgi:hypothetical protein
MERNVISALIGAVIFQFKVVFWVFRKLFQLVGFVRARSASKPQGLDFPLSARLEHTHIVAGSGHGKTQLIQSLIWMLDLDAVVAGKRSVVVIDSHGDMLKNILHLSQLSPEHKNLSERVIYIDPNDMENPPCLNLFDFGLDRLKAYTPVEREKLLNGAISLYEYMFGALLGAELPHRQGVIFRYLARLLMVVPVRPSIP